MDIDDVEPTTANVTSKLTSPTNQELNKLEQENKRQRKAIVKMQLQINDLQLSVKELVQHKNKEQEEKSFRLWQQTMTKNLILVTDTVKINKRSKEGLQNDVKGLKTSNESIKNNVKGLQNSINQLIGMLRLRGQ